MASQSGPSNLEKEQVDQAMASQSGPSNLEKEQLFVIAEKEMEFRMDGLTRLAKVCFEKCTNKRYRDSELNMDETGCIDRCAAKYFQVSNLVGQLLGMNMPPS